MLSKFSHPMNCEIGIRPEGQGAVRGYRLQGLVVPRSNEMEHLLEVFGNNLPGCHK